MTLIAMEVARGVDNLIFISILTIMHIAVLVTIAVMMAAATPLADFIERNLTIVMLAPGFLLMIGMTLVADGVGLHAPKGCIYSRWRLRRWSRD